MPFIAGIETSSPKHTYTQREILDFVLPVWEQKHSNSSRLESFYQNVLVERRNLAAPLEDYLGFESFEVKNNRWKEVALDLSVDCLEKLLASHDISPEKVGLLASSTVTGISVPSIEARVMNRIPFAASTRRMPLFGLGCLAGTAGINRVADYLKGNPHEAAIFFTVELCSLTVQLQNPKLANLVSMGLFGDGAAAVLMVGDKHPLAESCQLRWRDGASRFFPDSEDVMGWDMKDNGFNIVLSKDVAAIARDEVSPFINDFLADNHLKKFDLGFHMAHPGGPKVLWAMEEALGIDKNGLIQSWKSLRENGNMSSASVLYIARDVLKMLNDSSRDHDTGIMASMGPAFCAELTLLDWKRRGFFGK